LKVTSFLQMVIRQGKPSLEDTVEYFLNCIERHFNLEPNKIWRKPETEKAAS
jgi:hypothetical protein